MKKAFAIVASGLILAVANLTDVFAVEIDSATSLTPSQNIQYKDNEYVIDKYDIDIVVNENNVFDVTEKITAYFNVPKHGIRRKIPLEKTVTRLDGTTSKKRAQVVSVSVNNEYETMREGDNYIIKIGSAEKTVTGRQEYTIKYAYNLGEDPSKNYDELYYNIIGSGWDTAIGNVTFSVTMPKEFDASKVGFSAGIKGSTDGSKVKYNVSGNKITGRYIGILGAGEALTIRCELPEGYFVGAGYIIDPLVYAMFIVPIVGLIASLIIWYIFGRDNRVIETVEFYPPEGLNSLDVGFLYNGRAENKDVISLLIFLANKGYLEIADNRIDLKAEKVKLGKGVKESADKKVVELQEKIEEEKRVNPNSKKIKYYENMVDIYKNIDTPIDYKSYGLGVRLAIRKMNKEDAFVVKKVKDYDGTDVNEQRFFEGLFGYGKTEVTRGMLYNKFYITRDEILKNVNNRQNRDKIFERNTLWKVAVTILLVISLVVVVAAPTMEQSNFVAVIVTLGLCAFFAPFLRTGIFGRMTLLERIVWLGVVAVLAAVFLGKTPMVGVIASNGIYLCGFIVGVLCIFGMAMFLELMPKRNKYGGEMLGKLKGFRNFLITAEKEKLEAMVAEDPSYFYDILPYAYVLDVSDKWIKKFESISMQAPDWYDSTDGFSMAEFEDFMDSAMPSADSSSGFDSDSGGGSSDGGDGGGGGDSW